LLSLFQLIRNEFMKLFSRLSTWVMIGLLVLSVIGSGLLVNYFLSESDGNWRAALQAQNESIEGMLENEQLAEPIQATYEQELALNHYRLEHDLPPIEVRSMWGFTYENTILTSLITLFVIVVGAGIVASEFSQGTIKLLLIRPVHRWKILLSKYLTTCFFALLLFVILILSSLLFGAALFGLSQGSTTHLAYVQGEVVERSIFLHLLSSYALKSVELVMMATFAFMVSVVFRSSSLAIGLAIFLLFTGNQAVMILRYQYEWVKYILFANTNLNQYFSGQPLVEGMTLGFSMTVLLVYFILFHLLSWLTFTRRDVA
jgi:ABC-2 type transport system permease protein